MEAFLHPLQGLAEFGEIKKRCGANCGILNVSGCMESQKAVSYTHLRAHET